MSKIVIAKKKGIKQEKCLPDYPTPVSIEQSETILRQMKNNSVCQICKKDGIKGTGFFCKVPLSKDEYLPVFITNNHMIDEKDLKEENDISIKINNGQKKYISKSISLKKTFKYTNETYDVTIIEIKQNIDNIYDFLELDENILDNPIDNVGNSIYILHYPKEITQDKVAVSYGIIKEINIDQECDFNHYCNTTPGSSGSPILKLSNNKIIGVHKYASIENFNIGNFLHYPLKEFIEKYKRKKIKKLTSIFGLFNESLVKLFDKGFISDLIPIKSKYKEGNVTFSYHFYLPDENVAYRLICSNKNIPKDWVSAWHGTRHENVESIIENGLKLPGTKIKDKIINKNKSYIKLKDNVFGIKDWENAIFASKNIHYALSYCDEQFDYDFYETFFLIEVKIKPDGFTEHKSKFISNYYLGHGACYSVSDEADIYRIASEEDIIVISIIIVSALYCAKHKNDNNIIDFID